MYSCKDSIHRLLDFLDGDLSPEEEQRLQEHLGGCPPCVDFVKSYRATPALCKRALAARMPEELAHKLKGFLRDKMKC